MVRKQKLEHIYIDKHTHILKQLIQYANYFNEISTGQKSISVV